MMRRFPPLTKAEILERLAVDTASGKCFWVDATKHHKRLNGVEAGCPRATHPNEQPYWTIKLNSIPYKRSYLVFCVANGKWPTLIDHINGNSLDDRCANLREATPTQNAWNHRGRKKKTDTPMGVRKTRCGKYEARIGYNKRQISLGTFPLLSDALTAYLSARKELFGDYSGL